MCCVSLRIVTRVFTQCFFNHALLLSSIWDMAHGHRVPVKALGRVLHTVLSMVLSMHSKQLTLNLGYATICQNN